jgi:uncharacterized membrane protein YdcZ (DUF606 family)
LTAKKIDKKNLKLVAGVVGVHWYTLSFSLKIIGAATAMVRALASQMRQGKMRR